MRSIPSALIIEEIKHAVGAANYHIHPDIQSYLVKHKHRGSARETQVLGILLENADISVSEGIPLCQDTGSVVVFVSLGIDVNLEVDLQHLIDEGVRQGYQEWFLRKSIVSDPLKRINTEDNTPAIVHIEMVPGDQLVMEIMIKGGGSENISALTMLSPAEGADGIVDFVVERLRDKGANACPPLILGIGLGGNFENCALLAKKALLRPFRSRNRKSHLAYLEQRILDEVNALEIGAGGFGGKLTAMEVFIESAPCHIASLPVALNVGCHSTRHTRIRI